MITEDHIKKLLEEKQARLEQIRKDLSDRTYHLGHQDWLIAELEDSWKREEILKEALEKMANHNKRLAMNDRPGMSVEMWAIDKSFALLAEETLAKCAEGKFE